MLFSTLLIFVSTKKERNKQRKNERIKKQKKQKQTNKATARQTRNNINENIAQMECVNNKRFFYVQNEITVFPRITAGGDYFFFRTDRGRLFEGGDYFKYFSQEVVP